MEWQPFPSMLDFGAKTVNTVRRCFGFHQANNARLKSSPSFPNSVDRLSIRKTHAVPSKNFERHKVHKKTSKEERRKEELRGGGTFPLLRFCASLQGGSTC